MSAKDGEGRPSHASRTVQSRHSLDVASVRYPSRRQKPVRENKNLWIIAIVLTYPLLHRFDAFRSIFPAGTVSGAPKIKAIELVYDLEQDRRGVYAGAVGRFDFAEDEMDTCIAIRTMTFKDGVAYLQAGGGIVFDSVEEDEYVETINKLGSNVRALESAESEYLLLDYCIYTNGSSRRILV